MCQTLRNERPGLAGEHTVDKHKGWGATVGREKAYSTHPGGAPCPCPEQSHTDPDAMLMPKALQRRTPTKALPKTNVPDRNPEAPEDSGVCLSVTRSRSQLQTTSLNVNSPRGYHVTLVDGADSPRGRSCPLDLPVPVGVSFKEWCFLAAAPIGRTAVSRGRPVNLVGCKTKQCGHL